MPVQGATEFVYHCTHCNERYSDTDPQAAYELAEECEERGEPEVEYTEGDRVWIYVGSGDHLQGLVKDTRIVLSDKKHYREYLVRKPGGPQVWYNRESLSPRE